MRLRLQLGSLLVLLSLTFPLLAQPHRDAVTVEVVDVPVFVTRNSQPIVGLTRDDFELFVNGKPQPIEYFDVLTPAEAAAAPTLRERRLFLIVLDLAFSSPHALGRAQQAAAKLIANARPSDYFAIGSYSARRGIWLATPFTQDEAALLRGIGTLSQTKSGDPLSIVMTSAERAMLQMPANELAERSDPSLFDVRVSERMSGEAMRDIWQTQVQRATENQILNFADLGVRLGSLQGQKHVVLLSEGSDSAQRKHPVQIASRDFAMTGGLPEFPGAAPGGSSFGTLLRSLDELTESFQKSGVLLHAIDLTGLTSMFGGQTLHLLTSSTGGRNMHSRNDFGKALLELSNILGHQYVLSFKPPQNVRAGNNTIRVKLRNQPRGAALNYRQGFSGTPTATDVNEGLYLADVIMNDVPQSGTAASLELRDNTVSATIPMSEVAAQMPRGGTAELLVYVFGPNNTPLDFHRRTIDVEAGASGDQTIAIAVAPGAVSAKALLRVGNGLGLSRTR